MQCETRLRMMTGRYKLMSTALPVLAFALAGFSAQALAQSGETVSRAVVQPLPPAASDDLNEALLRLARDRRDVDALISAGLASLQLGDADAAIGFFGRAKELSPQNPRISEGMAAAYVRGGRPVEALKLFEEAEQAGISSGSLWADRGLAYDLVGQNGVAQAAYRRALSLKDDSEVRQRLALSHAIAGERQPFEEALKPMLDARDFAAYRTRAFGLAVLGEADEAIEIARAVMPRDLAGRIEPYLRFMPRLTKSQQAAAANLGLYPSAARIGRDDPRIAGAAGSVAAPGTSDATLEPRGEPLGDGAATQVARPSVRDLSDPLRRTIMRQPTARATLAIPPPPAASPTPAPAPIPAPISTGASEVRMARNDPAPTQVAGPPVADPASDPVPLAAANLGQPESRSEGPVTFDLAESQATRPVQAVPTPAPAASRSSGASTPVGLAEAFADFAEPTVVDVAGADVVDISAIEPVREAATPPPPPAPRRIWLQLGIGQNRSLLRSDWRLKYRKFDVLKDKGPFVTPLGQTNRLLAGPFDSQTQAREALNALAAQDIDSFIWTSAEGQQIDELR